MVYNSLFVLKVMPNGRFLDRTDGLTIFQRLGREEQRAAAAMDPEAFLDMANQVTTACL